MEKLHTETAFDRQRKQNKISLQQTIVYLTLAISYSIQPWGHFLVTLFFLLPLDKDLGPLIFQSVGICLAPRTNYEMQSRNNNC